MSYSAEQAEDSKPWCPPVDVYRAADHYVVKADLPGMEKSSIFVKQNGNTLYISGYREFEPGEDAEEHLRLERLHGKFICELHLPGMAADAVPHVDYHSGVLQIEVPFM